MTDEEAKQRLKNIILESIDRSIREAKEFEGKTLTRAEVAKAWKEHLDLAKEN